MAEDGAEHGGSVALAAKDAVTRTADLDKPSSSFDNRRMRARSFVSIAVAGLVFAQGATAEEPTTPPSVRLCDLARGWQGMGEAHYPAFHQLIETLAWAVQARTRTIEATFVSVPERVIGPLPKAVIMPMPSTVPDSAIGSMMM